MKRAQTYVAASTSPLVKKNSEIMACQTRHKVMIFQLLTCMTAFHSPDTTSPAKRIYRWRHAHALQGF